MAKSKSMKDDDGANYLKLIVYAFIAFASFVAAIVSGYFAFVGLFFGQAIVETDVFEDKYKYHCDYINGSKDVDTTTGECNNFNTSDPLTSWTDYQTSRSTINSLIPKFLLATFVIFSLLGLVFLFAALKSAGIGQKKKEKGGDDMW